MKTESTVNNYRICKRCVMDTTAPDIAFTTESYCNFCEDLLTYFQSKKNDGLKSQKQFLETFIEQVKKEGMKSKYDCVVGVSGGVDSSWVLVKVIEMGLRPLAVHMDNGWNSELAQNNIANLVRKLNVDLVTHVIDWREYRSLMESFFKADVIDVELLYDNAMLAVNYNNAKKFNIPYIFGGMNQATEGMKMPQGWNWYKYDKKNIKNIALKGGIKNFTTFPSIGTLDFIYYQFIKKIRWVNILDSLDYNKFDVLKILQSKFGYKPYPYKHYESIFTRFYQGFILPKKFGIDKRRLHLSTLIISNQMSRQEALDKLNEATYQSHQLLEEDISIS